MESGSVYGELGSSSQSFDVNSWNREESTFPQVNLETILTLAPLGLRLTETPALLEKVDQLTLEQSGYEDPENYNYATARLRLPNPQPTNKMKADNFQIRLLKIGTWQRVTVNEGDLVAKCYFAKRKLVWELLENGLKKKIEILWSEILSFNASFGKDRTGVLEIELNQPPMFYREREPRPRKHTQWKSVNDFTFGSQASRYRIHHLEFPPAMLERTLERLLKVDQHWAKISKRGFPSQESPYFPLDHEFSLEFGGHGSSYVHHQQQFSFSNVPPAAATSLLTHYPAYEHTPQQSLTIKDSDSPSSDEPISNQAPLGWAQGLNNVTDSTLTTNSVGGMGFAGFAAGASSSSAHVNMNPVGVAFNAFAAAAASARVNSAMSALQSQNYLGTYAQEVDRNQLGGIIPTPLNSQMHPQQQGLPSLQDPTMYMQQPRYDQKVVNNFQNRGSLQIGNHNGVAAEGNLYREGNATSGNIDVVRDFVPGMIDDSLAMNNSNNYWPNNGGSTIDPPSLMDSWMQMEASFDVLPTNHSPVFSDPSAEYSAKTFTEINMTGI